MERPDIPFLRNFSGPRTPVFFRLADHPAFFRSPGVCEFLPRRSPNTAKCRFQITQHGEMSFPGYPDHEISSSRSPGFETRLADHPAFSRSPGVSGFRSPGAAKCRFQVTQHGEMSFPGYPTRRNVVSRTRLPVRRNFFFPDHPVVGCAG